MRTLFLALACFAAISTTWSQTAEAPSKPVEIRLGATRVPQALEALAKQTGVPMKTIPFYENEVIILRSKTRDLNTIMRKIAEAVAGEWKLVEGVYVLGRDQQRILEQEKQSRQNAIANIQKAQSEARKILESAYTLESVQDNLKKQGETERKMQGGTVPYEVWRSYQRLSNMGPFQRAAMRVFIQIDPKALVDIPKRGRLVFSTSANSMQRPMAGGVSVAQILTNEQKVYADARGSQVVAPDGDQRIFFGAFETPSKEFKKPIGKLLLVIERDRWSRAASECMLHVIATDGKSLGSASLDINGMSVDDKDVEKITKAEKHVVDPKEQPLELSAQTTAILAFLHGRSMNVIRPEAWTALPEDILNLLCQPETHDPLAGPLSDCFLSYADRKGIDLIGVMDESWAGWSRSQKEDKGIRPSQLEKFYEKNMRIEDGWLHLAPNDPVTCRQERLDRASLGAFYRQVRMDGRVTLDSLATFLLQNDGRPAFNAQNTLNLIVPGSSADFWQKGDEDALRLYATLSPAQRQALDSGAKLAISNLTGTQKDYVRRLTFGSEVSLQKNENEAPEVDVEDMDAYSGFNTASEPTELLPRGIPNGATLSWSSEKKDVLYGYDAGEDRNSYSYGQEIEGIAAQLYYKLHPELFPWADDNPSLDVFRAAKRRDISISLTYSPVVSGQYTLSDDVFLNGRPVKRDQLPAEVLKVLEAEMKKLADQFKNIKPGEMGFGQEVPPPPPHR